MNFEEDQHQFSETWDPSAHRRLHFPVLQHPDARPEQAPNQGVRELLYQYEAMQATVPRGPLNIFWNDEGDNHSNQSDDEAELRELRNRLMNDPAMNPPTRGRALCTGTLIVAILLFCCSATVLIVGTVCVFGQCGGTPKQPAAPTVPTLIYTRRPTAAPTPSPQAQNSIGESGIPSSEASDGSNIFAQPTNPPTIKPSDEFATEPSDGASTLSPTLTDASQVSDSTIFNNSTESSSSSAMTNNETYSDIGANTSAPTLAANDSQATSNTTTNADSTPTLVEVPMLFRFAFEEENDNTTSLEPTPKDIKNLQSTTQEYAVVVFDFLYQESTIAKHFVYVTLTIDKLSLQPPLLQVDVTFVVLYTSENTPHPDELAVVLEKEFTGDEFLYFYLQGRDDLWTNVTKVQVESNLVEAEQEEEEEEEDYVVTATNRSSSSFVQSLELVTVMKVGSP